MEAVAKSLGQTDQEKPGHWRLLVFLVSLAVLVTPGLAAIGSGYLPPDDARRHVAKVFSGKDWSEIVVMNERVYAGMDTHPGWHAILGFIQRLLGLGQDGLMVTGILLTWMVFALAPAMGRGGTLGAALALTLIGVVEPASLQRMLLARPFALMAGLTIVLLILWERLSSPGSGSEKNKGRLLGGVALCAAICVWMQSTWYLLALPVIAVFGDTRYRWKTAMAFTIATGVGTVLGALLTGQPWNYLVFQLQHAFWSITESPLPKAFLVAEFRPYFGSIFLFGIGLALYLVNRRAQMRRGKRPRIPAALILAGLGMVLGFWVVRFWSDWGLPAIYLLLSVELGRFLRRRRVARPMPRQLLVAGIAGCLMTLVVLPKLPLSEMPARRLAYLKQELGHHPGTLPGKGGIIYASGMGAFYDLFYLFPEADWRYQIGFEPGLMPREDLEILAGIATQQDLESWQPWLRRMREEDRLIFRVDTPAPPRIGGMNWTKIESGPLWVGRIDEEKGSVDRGGSELTE